MGSKEVGNKRFNVHMIHVCVYVIHFLVHLNCKEYGGDRVRVVSATLVWVDLQQESECT